MSTVCTMSATTFPVTDRPAANTAPPASTTALARRHAMSPAGASRHLVALRDAGLVTGTRHGHEVRYARTRLGTELIRPADRLMPL
jgi:DNA-binding transcriptional ArsR family regulator